MWFHPCVQLWICSFHYKCCFMETSINVVFSRLKAPKQLTWQWKKSPCSPGKNEEMLIYSYVHSLWLLWWPCSFHLQDKGFLKILRHLILHHVPSKLPMTCVSRGLLGYPQHHSVGRSSCQSGWRNALSCMACIAQHLCVMLRSEDFPQKVQVNH